MKYIFMLLFIFVSLYAEVESVVATGYGINQDKALDSAIKQAIQQVVGRYVTSDTIMKNDKLIKDEVLSVSNGFIKDYKTLNVTQNDGLWEATINAQVELGKVIKRLEDFSIATKSIDNKTTKIASSKAKTLREFKTMAKKIMLDPLLKNKKIYDVNVVSLKELNEDSKLYKENLSRISEALEKLKFPFLLTYKIKLNPDYFESVYQFIKNNAESCQDPMMWDSLTDKEQEDYIVFNSKLRIYKKSWLIMSDDIKYQICKLKHTKRKVIESVLNDAEHIGFKVKINLYDKNNNVLKTLYRDTVSPEYQNYKSIINSKTIEFLYSDNYKDHDYFHDKFIPVNLNSTICYIGYKDDITISYIIALDEEEIEKLDSVKLLVEKKR